jgi:hypothetical protein
LRQRPEDGRRVAVSVKGAPSIDREKRPRRSNL